MGWNGFTQEFDPNHSKDTVDITLVIPLSKQQNCATAQVAAGSGTRETVHPEMPPAEKCEGTNALQPQATALVRPPPQGGSGLAARSIEIACKGDQGNSSIMSSYSIVYTNNQASPLLAKRKL